MSSRTKNYRHEAMDDAKNTARNFLDEIVEQLISDGKASDDLNNDYSDGDTYHHENHVDQWYNLTDADKLLDELSDHEETDSGLWDSLSPRDAISAQAAYTYGNAVYSMWTEVIKEINDDPILQDALQDKEELTEEVNERHIKGLVEEIINNW